MANQEHLDILKQGVKVWNQWREAYPDIQPDLSEASLDGLWLKDINLRQADLRGTYLSKAILIGADLRGATLVGANLYDADLSFADLHQANLRQADLRAASFSETKLRQAQLSEADFLWAKLYWSDLSEANLRGARLNNASIVHTNLKRADLTGCFIYGISAWDVDLEGAVQSSLIITPPGEPTITVDNLEVAQFIYLLLNNKKIREVIDTITSKVVLILGRFTDERKKVLDAIKDELRRQNYTPVLFDFEKPANRDLTETVSILARLARFIIVDLTDPSSVPHEVATIIPQCIVPVQPLLLEDDVKPRHEYAMFHDLRTRYHWVLPTYQYKNIANLLASLKEHIIEPAEQKAKDLAQH